MHPIGIAGTDARFDCAEGDTILRAGLRAGLGLSYECNVGSCGSCKLDLVEGEVRPLWAEAPGLTARDRERGRILACQSKPLGPCTIKARLADHYRPRQRPCRQMATLVATVDVTHDLREFRFRTGVPAEFTAGQYALLALDGVSGMRAYSMCNLPNTEGDWHFQIKRVLGGAASAKLFDDTALGSRIELDGPYGLAYLRADSARDIVCIAGGSGLSPMIAIARAVALERRLAAAKLHFFYGGRGPQDICGESMLRELGGFGERIFYYPTISMPEEDTAGEWRGHVGFVHELAAATLGANLAAHEVYFAGPPAMALAVQRILLQHKVPQAQTHFDRFF